MLEGFRREVAVNGLCQREGVKPHFYYLWGDPDTPPRARSSSPSA